MLRKPGALQDAKQHGGLAHTRLPEQVEVQLVFAGVEGAPPAIGDEQTDVMQSVDGGVELGCEFLRNAHSRSQNRREHLTWTGTRRARRGDVHPVTEQDLTLGFEFSDVAVGTAFLHGDYQLGIRAQVDRADSVLSRQLGEETGALSEQAIAGGR